ncbi:hypothetical protein [Sorangium sp. So ce204]|uniref:hypothetical protein n=1 Tax=Sorangium sp. So ce204 TaxID=3133288 RepID=UPI003F608F16
MANDDRNAPCYLHAVIQIKPGRLEEFRRLTGEIRTLLGEKFGVRLAASFQAASSPDKIVNVWAVPSRETLEQLNRAAPDEPLIQAYEACIEREEVDAFVAFRHDAPGAVEPPAPPAAAAPNTANTRSTPIELTLEIARAIMGTDRRSISSDSDQTILIAGDDGQIHQILREEWSATQTLAGDAKDWVEQNMLRNGVTLANLPVDVLDPFFACYLLNLAMIKEPPAQVERSARRKP